MPLSKVKTKILAEEYLRNGLNATQAVKKFRPAYNNNVAKVAASRMLASDNFKESIQEVMEEQGITDKMLLREHTKVIKQDKHLPSKNGAIDMAYKLKGSYAPIKSESKTLSININDIKQVEERTKQLLDELKQLNT